MNNYKTGIQARHTFLQCAREFLAAHDFLEIQTPKISFMPTDQDAHLFKTDYFGNSAYLVQTPQFYKQAYVINGISSVFEVAPVFRAEPRVTPRHLSEFTSLDIESSQFSQIEDIIQFESDLIGLATKGLSKAIDIKPIETFEVAEYKNVKKMLGLSDSEQITNVHEPAISKLFKADGIFIIHYPSNERAFYYEDCDEISLSFDLIVGGMEVTSGGVRTISKESLLRKMKKDNIDPARYTPYLKMFDGTVPVHGGFAIGVERIILKYLQLSDIGDVIPYSKKPDTNTEALIWKP